MSVSKGPIECIAVNQDLRKLAVASMGQVTFYDLNTWEEQTADKIEIMKTCGKITRLHWTKDGSIMTVTTANGYFIGFLTVVPNLNSTYEKYASVLSSLTEISVVDVSKNNMVVARTNLDVEPAFLNLGPTHFAVGINNSVWYYRWRLSTSPAAMDPNQQQ